MSGEREEEFSEVEEIFLLMLGESRGGRVVGDHVEDTNAVDPDSAMSAVEGCQTM